MLKAFKLKEMKRKEKSFYGFLLLLMILVSMKLFCNPLNFPSPMVTPNWRYISLENWSSVSLFYLFLRLYLFIFRERGREGNINVWLPTGDLAHNPGTCPAQTTGPLIRRLALNPLSHTSQGWLGFFCFYCFFWLFFRSFQHLHSY